MKNNYKDPNFLLDKVLEYIVSYYEDVHWAESNNGSYIYANNSDLIMIHYRIFKTNTVGRDESKTMKLIIKKLFKDGYIELTEKPSVTINSDNSISMHIINKNNPEMIYGITFEGIVFSKNGGYSRKSRKDFISTTFQLITTILIAVGTFGIFCFEIGKRFRLFQCQ